MAGVVVSKVLAVVGSIASIAAMVPGPHQPIAAAIAVAANIGSAVLAKPPPAKGSVNQIQIGANMPTPYAIGRTYVGGNMVHDVGYGGSNNPYKSMVLVWSGGGPIHSIESFQGDFSSLSFSGGNAIGYYNNYLYLSTSLGARPQAAALTGPFGAIPGWGSAAKISGKTHGLVTLKFDKKGKRFASGIPQFGVVGKWVLAYDPRKDSTYPGGSGSHRFDDETTWEWTDNPALHGIAYARGRYENGKKVFGCGYTKEAIDLAAFVAHANVCDANGWTVGGVIYEPGSRKDNLKYILEAGGGEPVFGARLSVRYAAPKVALDTVTADDLADGDYIVPAMRSWRDRLNGIIPKYRSEAHKWEYVQSEAVSVEQYVEEDGEEKQEERQFSLVQDKDQAAQLASYVLVNGREFGPIVLPLKPRLGAYGPGETLEIDIPELGLNQQLCEITQRDIDPGTAIVTLTFVSETDDKHAFALGQTGTAPPTPSITASEDLDEIISSNSYRAAPHVVADEAEMLALDVAEGEIAIRTDLNATFIHNGGTSGTTADWTEAPGGGGGTLVDGDYGDIVVSGVGTALTIDSNAVTFGKFIAATGAGLVGATGAGSFAQLTPAQGRTILELAAVANSGSAADLTGTLANARLDAFTGDATKAAGSGVLTLATVNSNTGTFGGAKTSPQFSVNGKGLVTGVAAVTIQPDYSSIDAVPTARLLGRSTAGTGFAEALTAAQARTLLALVPGTDIVAFNGAGGTPSSLTLTNATGLPTAGMVDDAVTNAKLANMVQATIKGRASGAGTGDPTDLTGTQVRAVLGLATTDSVTFASLTTTGSAVIGNASGATATPTSVRLDTTYRNSAGNNQNLKFYLYWNGTETYGFGLNSSGIIEYHAGPSGTSTGGHDFYVGGTRRMILTSTGLDVTGELRCDTFRIDATPTAGATTPTHHFTVNLNGTNYRVPCLI